MRLLWYNTSGTGWTASKSLSAMVSNPPSSGRMIARGVFQRPSAFTGVFASISAVVDANYLNDAVYGTRVAKTIAIHRVSIRVATEEEIGSGAVGSQIDAKIATQDTVVVSREQAIANSVTTLNSDYQGTKATVTIHATTLAYLKGSVATLDFVTVAGTQYVAGIRATSWDAAGAGSGSLLQLIGDNVVAEGTLSANKLVVGLGKNFVENSSFKHGLVGWNKSGSGQVNTDTTWSIVAPGGTWSGPASPTLRLYQSSNATTGSTVVRNYPIVKIDGTVAKGVAVVPGEVIEVSVAMSSHRCTGDVRIHYFDASGANFTGSGVIQSLVNTPGTEGNPEAWPRIGGRHTVPAGAVLAAIAIYKNATMAGSADSELHIYQPQLCRTHAAATALTPYSPDGTTLIDGGSVITNSLVAAAVNTASFSVAGLSIFGGTLQSDNWDGAGNGWQITKAGQLTVPNASISTAKIGEAQVTTLKMRDGDISFLHQVRTGQLGTWQDNVQNRLVDSWFWVGYDSNVQFDIRVYSNWTAINWMFIWCSAIGTLYNGDPANEPFSFSWSEARRVTAGSHEFVVEVRTQNATSQALSSVYFDAVGMMR